MKGKITNTIIKGTLVAFVVLLPFIGYGATTTTTKPSIKIAPPLKSTLEVSGWIPYWRKATGTADALVHLDTFTELNPFGYTIKNDGTLNDTAKMDEEPWLTLIKEAKKKKVRIIPTVMTSNGEMLHRILSNQKTRIALEDEIAALVKEKGFDGIDIDFEGKKAETKPYFSTFLKGLYQRMGNKWVMCTIEARTPLDSRYDNIPKDIRYANDFVAINKYCDRVRFMTYDQGTIDIVLNRARTAPYIPVADPAWVEKSIRLAMKDISKRKISIGIATYGYEYKVTKLSEYGYRYDLQWAFNPRYATDLALSLNITPQRNSSGEIGFMYTPVETVPPTQPSNNPDQNIKTSTVAENLSTSNVSNFTNIVWWSDAKAIKDKVDLAKKLGVRGVSIFKIDGGEDPAMWDVLK
ncbi:MAG: glycosyl hydrolase family 18 protein [Candidatus Paceibacterota bacterium]|jgi:spore germination protein YaaH